MANGGMRGWSSTAVDTLKAAGQFNSIGRGAAVNVSGDCASPLQA
jgi:hypothetical protein